MTLEERNIVADRIAEELRKRFPKPMTCTADEMKQALAEICADVNPYPELQVEFDEQRRAINFTAPIENPPRDPAMPCPSCGERDLYTNYYDRCYKCGRNVG